MTNELKPCRYQYRLVWKREGLNPKSQTYANLKTAEKKLLFFKDPLSALSKGEPDSYMCCKNYSNECGCGGLTWREHIAEKYWNIPKLEWMKIERRVIGKWEPTEAE